jgi:four helix bundle protein
MMGGEDGEKDYRISGFERLATCLWPDIGSLSYYKMFPKVEIYGLTSQLQRAAVSVPANIAEGYERNHRKEYLQFLFVAKGSLGELDTLLLLVRDLSYMTIEDFDHVNTKRHETMKMLQGLIKSLS